MASKHEEASVSENTEPAADSGGSHTGDPGGQQRFNKPVAVLKTCFIALMYFVMGSWDGVISPSYVDLTEIFHCDIEHISRAAMTKGFGIWAGTVCGAIAADRYRGHTDVFLFVGCLVGGLSCIAIPWSPNITMVAVFFAVTGVCHAMMQVCGNTVVMAMWKEKASLPLHLLMASNAVGYTVTPPITGIFLSPDNTTNTTNSLQPHSDMYTSQIFKSLSFNHGASKVWYAYSIFGGFGVLVGIAFLTFAICKVQYPGVVQGSQSSFKDMFRSWGGSESKGFTIYIYISAVLYFGFNRMRVNCLHLFLFTIAVKTENIQLSKQMAALFLTTFRICFMSGRFLGGLLSVFIPLQIIVACMVFSDLAMHIIMALFALQSTTLLWTLSCVTGLLVGPTYPAAMSLYNRYVEMTGLMVALADIGLGLGTMSSTWLSGFLFQYKGPEFVFYMLIAGGAGVCLVMVPLQIVFALRGDRFSRVSPDKERHVQHEEISANGDIGLSDETEPLVA